MLTVRKRSPRLEAAFAVHALLALSACSGGNSTVAPPRLDSGAHPTSIGGPGSTGGSSGSSGGGSGSDIASSADDDGAADDATTSSDTGVAVDTGVADTGVAAPEAGVVPASTCQAPTGGAACDPGIVTCGSTSCSTSSSYCCADDDGGACTAYNSAGCPSTDLTLQCDEAADCASGVCCEQAMSLGVAGPTQCMSSCPTGWFQICRSNTECGTGDGGGVNRCVLQTCTQAPTLLTAGSSVVVEACAVPPGFITIGIGTSGPTGALSGCVAQ
jgi:hypothetical protein